VAAALPTVIRLADLAGRVAARRLTDLPALEPQGRATMAAAIP
jgi:hypothetical protein